MKQSYQWILEAINSSLNGFHIKGCYALIELFKSLYGEEAKEYSDDLLRAVIDRKTYISIEI